MVRIRGSGGRPEDDTWDPGQFLISQDLGGGWKVDQKRSEKRGALLLSLLSAALALPTDAGGCVNRPYHVQKVLRIIPVASSDKRQKKLIGL